MEKADTISIFKPKITPSFNKIANYAKPETKLMENFDFSMCEKNKRTIKQG